MKQKIFVIMCKIIIESCKQSCIIKIVINWIAMY